MLAVSETYILEVDIDAKPEESRITIYKKDGIKLIPVNTLYGEEAESLYFGKLRKGDTKDESKNT